MLLVRRPGRRRGKVPHRHLGQAVGGRRCRRAASAAGSKTGTASPGRCRWRRMTRAPGDFTPRAPTPRDMVNATGGELGPAPASAAWADAAPCPRTTRGVRASTLAPPVTRPHARTPQEKPVYYSRMKKATDVAARGRGSLADPSARTVTIRAVSHTPRRPCSQREPLSLTDHRADRMSLALAHA